VSDKLDEMMRLQKQLQVEAFGADPSVMQDADRIQYIKDMVLAATDELHEALAEVGWKPWATSKHLNRGRRPGGALHEVPGEALGERATPGGRVRRCHREVLAVPP
jgi:hypothetical protein